MRERFMSRFRRETDANIPAAAVATAEECPKIKLAEEGIENLSFSSGSVMGVAFLGALKRLDWSGLKRVGGTSIGAFMALCLAIGYKYEEIEAEVKEMYKTGLSYIMGLSVWDTPKMAWNFTKSFCSLGGHVYLSTGDRLREWVKKLMVRKLGEGAENMTFSQLKDWQDRNVTNENPLPHLHTHAVDLDRRENLEYSHETTPNKKVIDAVMESMMIPFLFKGGTDGGTTNNHPLDTWDRVKYFPEAEKAHLHRAGLSDEHIAQNRHTLGLYLKPHEISHSWHPSIIKTISTIVGTAMIAPNKHKASSRLPRESRTSSDDRTVEIDCAPYHYFSTHIKKKDFEAFQEVSSSAVDLWEARRRRSGNGGVDR